MDDPQTSCVEFFWICVVDDVLSNKVTLHTRFRWEKKNAKKNLSDVFLSITPTSPSNTIGTQLVNCPLALQKSQQLERDRSKTKAGKGHMSNKQNPLYWLQNMDPYNGLLKSLYNRVVYVPHIRQKARGLVAVTNSP